jgi:hypothetical protein
MSTFAIGAMAENAGLRVDALSGGKIRSGSRSPR